MISRIAFATALALAAGLSCTGCATAPPTRYVVERDLGPLFYRRYQKTLDVEFVVAGNAGTGHTATYLRRGSQTTAFATAFVTVYEHARSLSAEVRERLAGLNQYKLAVEEIDGQHAWTISRADERWAIWVSGQYVIKLGAPRGEALPEELAEAYMDAYPSDLDEHGRAREDAESRGESHAQRAREQADAAQRPSSTSLRRKAERGAH